MPDKLSTYWEKRHFDATPEPRGRAKRAVTQRFVIQQHHARRLHYDFRLELDGVLKSWAVPKGPSLDPSVKRLAVQVEDHPVEYGDFEGQIPAGNYGAGDVLVWDRGVWTPHGDARADYAAGKLKFDLQGDKLSGAWMLVRSHMRGSGDKEQWLLIKERDDAARSEADFDIVAARPESVKTGRTHAPDGEPAEQPAGKRVAARGQAAARAPAKPAKAPAKSAKAPAKSAKAPAKSVKAPAKLAKEPAEPAQAPAKQVARESKSAANAALEPRPINTKATPPPSLEGARAAALPATLSPQLATLVDAAPPDRDSWTYEIKFDGYRVLARVAGKGRARTVRIFTRNGHDWTDRFPAQAAALKALEIDDGWLDGEAVVLDERGVPSFQALQNAFEVGRTDRITLYLFDLPFLNGHDLREVALDGRRAALEAVLAGQPGDGALRFSATFSSPPESLLESACGMALEGIIGKRRDASYITGRSASWIKLKCRRRQEFVIGGYSDPQGARNEFGALLLGVYEAPGQLRYAGRVGSGFSQQSLKTLAREFAQHASASAPFFDAAKARGRARVHWLAPALVAEVEFSEWTDEGLVRQASFVGLRQDKPAASIGREAAVDGATTANQAKREAVAKRGSTMAASKAGVMAATMPADKAASGRAKRAKTAAVPEVSPRATAPAKTAARAGEAVVAEVRISHADRVIDAQSQTTKADIARYYAMVAPWLVAHLADRPTSLVRAPDGIGGELFFQKHIERFKMPGLRLLDPALDPGHPALMVLDNEQALVGAAQMGTIELHTWNATASAIEKPDRMIFDLDPDPSLPWSAMLDAARLTRALLDELGLTSFCKTSGGKGLHVVVPLTRHDSWDEVKEFSQAVTEHLAVTLPERFSAKMGPKNRIGKIFVDYLRNRRGASTVCAFSVRARPGMGVSVPIDWDELDTLAAADQWTLHTLHERLEALGKVDPWRAFWKTRQRITAAMRRRLDGQKKG
ncbi:MAG: DNA ligase D [Janthinobacterium lividum]